MSLTTKGEQNPGKTLLEWEALGCDLFKEGITSFLFTVSPQGTAEVLTS